MIGTILKWVAYRLVEASTWAGVSAFTYSLAGLFPQYATVFQGIGSVAAALAVGMKGGSGEYKEALGYAEKAMKEQQADAVQRRIKVASRIK
jgi:hypothetical protein